MCWKLRYFSIASMQCGQPPHWLYLIRGTEMSQAYVMDNQANKIINIVSFSLSGLILLLLVAHIVQFYKQKHRYALWKMMGRKDFIGPSYNASCIIVQLQIVVFIAASVASSVLDYQLLPNSQFLHTLALAFQFTIDLSVTYVQHSVLYAKSQPPSLRALRIYHVFVVLIGIIGVSGASAASSIAYSRFNMTIVRVYAQTVIAVQTVT